LPTAIAWQCGEVVERRSIELTRADEQFVLPCAAAPTWVCVDPDGHLPAEWSEKGSADSLLARALARELSAPARARACIAAGRLAASEAVVEGLSGIAMHRTQPELVRREAIKALGALRGEVALQALLGALEGLERPRLRRVAAEALAEFRHHHGATTPAMLAQRLVETADRETSLLTAGELFAARGAIQHPGASPALRARLGRASWNDRLAIGCLRGLGASGEAAAIDDVLPLFADRQRSDALRGAACLAAAQLGAEHLPARTRIRRALEVLLSDDSMALRATAAKALARLGDPAARAALATLREREPYGNVRRVLRESLHALDKAAANSDTHAALSKRVDELAKENADLKRRFEAIEKRLDPS
jgi:HEAT repeat protein